MRQMIKTVQFIVVFDNLFYYASVFYCSKTLLKTWMVQCFTTTSQAWCPKVEHGLRYQNSPFFGLCQFWPLVTFSSFGSLAASSFQWYLGRLTGCRLIDCPEYDVSVFTSLKFQYSTQNYDRLWVEYCFRPYLFQPPSSDVNMNAFMFWMVRVLVK